MGLDRKNQWQRHQGYTCLSKYIS